MSTQNAKLQEGIDKLPDDVRKQISEKLFSAHILINSAEVLMNENGMNHSLILMGQNYYTLWQQLYDLQQHFEGTRRI